MKKKTRVDELGSKGIANHHYYAPAVPLTLQIESGSRSFTISAGTMQELRTILAVCLSFKEVQEVLGYKEEGNANTK